MPAIGLPQGPIARGSHIRLTRFAHDLAQVKAGRGALDTIAWMHTTPAPYASRACLRVGPTLVGALAFWRGTCRQPRHAGRVSGLGALLLAAGLWAQPALAQTRVAVPVSGALKEALEARGDVDRGRVAYEDCQGCHGKAAGGRASGAIPRLSGQHASVLIKQLLDIRSGQRLNPQMKRFVETDDMTPQVFADIAAYLQSLPVTGPPGIGTGQALAQGQALYTQRCAACHGARGEGQAEQFIPMLAAQHQAYLVRELGLIRNGSRGNSNPAMVQMLQGLDANDYAALADHLSRLPVPARP